MNDEADRPLSPAEQGLGKRFKQMTAQEVFDYGAKHLLRQGRRSEALGRPSCRFRGPDGLMCGAGAFLSDDLATRFDELDFGDLSEEADDAVNESLSIATIAEHVPDAAWLGGTPGLPVLAALQDVHDEHEAGEWPQRLREAAERLALSPAVVEAP